MLCYVMLCYVMLYYTILHYITTSSILVSFVQGCFCSNADLRLLAERADPGLDEWAPVWDTGDEASRRSAAIYYHYCYNYD